MIFLIRVSVSLSSWLSTLSFIKSRYAFFFIIWGSFLFPRHLHPISSLGKWKSFSEDFSFSSRKVVCFVDFNFRGHTHTYIHESVCWRYIKYRSNFYVPRECYSRGVLDGKGELGNIFPNHFTKYSMHIARYS